MSGLTFSNARTRVDSAALTPKNILEVCPRHTLDSSPHPHMNSRAAANQSLSSSSRRSSVCTCSMTRATQTRDGDNDRSLAHSATDAPPNRVHSCSVLEHSHRPEREPDVTLPPPRLPLSHYRSSVRPLRRNALAHNDSASIRSASHSTTRLAITEDEARALLLPLSAALSASTRRVVHSANVRIEATKSGSLCHAIAALCIGAGYGAPAGLSDGDYFVCDAIVFRACECRPATSAGAIPSDARSTNRSLGAVGGVALFVCIFCFMMILTLRAVRCNFGIEYIKYYLRRGAAAPELLVHSVISSLYASRIVLVFASVEPTGLHVAHYSRNGLN